MIQPRDLTWLGASAPADDTVWAQEEWVNDPPTTDDCVAGRAPLVTLRAATLADAPLLTAWDHEPHVIRCTTDDPHATTARDAGEWEAELCSPTPHFEHLIAEVDGQPIGAMLIIDPALEPTHYWGKIERDLRAIDIWIGPASALGRGYGTEMMTRAIDRCFADATVTAIVIDPLASNLDAHRFYRRLGFRKVGYQSFGEDYCLVHRLERDKWQKLRLQGITHA